METQIGTELSDLSRIDDVSEDPFDLFRLWHDDARKYLFAMPDVLCLATTTKDNKVAARTVVLREFDNDGFVLVTDKRSRKASELEEVPNAAMCFLWCYINDKGENVARQVRVEGAVIPLESKNYKHLYDREPVFCKIRSHLCYQDRAVEWEDLKRRHDEILDEYRKGKNNLPMPDHFIGYKLLPSVLEFYYARDQLIGDRVYYKRNSLTEPWKHDRLAA